MTEQSKDQALMDLLEYLSTLAISGGDSPEQKAAAFDVIRDIVCTWQALNNERIMATENKEQR